MVSTNSEIERLTLRDYILILLLLILVAGPYLLAQRAAGEAFVFGGFLLNPIDGNSYLAKMYQGWLGNWSFTLPYTAQVGQGHFIFLFYLALGHLARLSGLSLLLTYHLARLVGALCLALALHQFLAQPPERPKYLGWAFALALFGSGMGWLALPFGKFPSDFWVAETYPFLSAYTNPHFALGLALLLWLLLAARDPRRPGWLCLLLALALAVAMPFGVAMALAVLGALAAWEAWAGWRAGQGWKALWRQLPQRFLWTLSGGGPVLLYYLWVTQTDPLLAGWNAQNLTPSPPLWDLALSLSPALLLALPGAWLAWKRRIPSDRLLLVWALLGLGLLYLPLGLQRRLMTGLYIPLIGLAGLGLEQIETRLGKRTGLLATLTLVFALLTNLLVLLAGQQGARTHAAELYLQRGEASALAWIAQDTPPQSLVLASPGMGLFIPAYTGRRVLYGHPFETVNAVQEQAAVEQFFSAGVQAGRDFLAQRGVDYILYGPRERALGNWLEQSGLPIVYQADGIVIYAAQP